MIRALKLHLLEDKFTISKLPQFAEMPVTVARGDMCFVFRTDNELSMITPEFMAPTNVQQEIGWRCIRVDGEMKYSEPGIAEALIAPLAVADISLFTVTTFDTIYLFLQEDTLVNAVQALQHAGHEFVHKE